MLIELCELFSCSMDQLIRKYINVSNGAYSNIRVEEINSFRYVKYEVISKEPEADAINHLKAWAINCGIKAPEIIGWDFPNVSQEQINVLHMHGYAAACILPENFQPATDNLNITTQKKQPYAIITIKEPFNNPFTIIPNAYKTLMLYMDVNGLKHIQNKEVLSCFEKEYEMKGISYMDVYIALDK